MWEYNHSYSAVDNSEAAKHYGILGMKWGVRRYQNEDGTLTAAGRRKQQRDEKKHRKQLEKDEYKRKVELTRRQEEWDTNVERNWYKAYNAASDVINETLIPNINKKYGTKDPKSPFNTDHEQTYPKYEAEFNREADRIQQEEFLKMFGKRPE